MYSKLQKKASELLDKVRQILSIAESNPGIAQKIAGVGYNPVRLEEGRLLLAEAQTLCNRSISGCGAYKGRC